MSTATIAKPHTNTRPTTTPAATGESTVDSAVDARRAVVAAVRASLTELDKCHVSDLTEDVDLAEVFGRLKALTGILVAVVDA